MTAIVDRQRVRAFWLTGAAGMLMLAAAAAMMVYAAPRLQTVRPPVVHSRSVTGDKLASWIWVTQGSRSGDLGAPIRTGPRP